MKALRPLLVFAVAVAVVLGGVHLLQEATEYHGGAGVEAQTTVLFKIKDNDFGHGDSFAATALWQTCIATIGWTGEDEPIPAGERTFRAVLHPSLPKDTRRRLRGCLEDLVVNHVKGNVVSMHSGAA
ncbi:hypothetical protein [Frankia tisae]|uniref:hypothetical protein n=1 Tax=Frankia tisae TaxID=2950104 RepID=UPI0021C18EC0|nr:hypothetical protein [Frankia tisae]